MNAYWRAANYLSVGQIYLLGNPLLKEPLKSAHVKPRLLGHWGTTPGLNFIYLHLNRVINRQTDHFCLSWLSLADPPYDLPEDESQESARPRIQRGGHDHNPVRYDSSE